MMLHSLFYFSTGISNGIFPKIGFMMQLDDLLNHYKEKLEPKMKKYDVLRIVLKIKNILLITIMVLALLFMILAWKEEPKWAVYSFAVALLTLGLYLLTLRFDGIYVVKYKYLVIKDLIKFYRPEWEYSSHATQQRDRFYSSKLFGQRADSIISCDSVVGTAAGYPFECARITASYKEKVHRGDSMKEVSRNVFEGLLVSLELEREQPRDLFLSLSVQECSFDTEEVCSKNDFPGGISLYCNDPQQIMHIVQKDLYKLLETLGTDLRISFVGHTLNIAISKYRDVFYPFIGAKKRNLKNIENIYQLFSTLEKIAEKF